MAEKGAEMLDQLTSGESLSERHVMLPVRLIERSSVA
jgi:hypothetical protein